MTTLPVHTPGSLSLLSNTSDFSEESLAPRRVVLRLIAATPRVAGLQPDAADTAPDPRVRRTDMHGLGLPYFNVFWTAPAEAAHDWPDFGDVTSRQLQAPIMARYMTGQECRNEKLWLKRVLSYLDPQTGLLIRPKTSFSEPVADLVGDRP